MQFHSEWSRSPARGRVPSRVVARDVVELADCFAWPRANGRREFTRHGEERFSGAHRKAGRHTSFTSRRRESSDTGSATRRPSVISGAA